MLAGVSVDYYTRLEKGHLQGASDSVLDAIADALRLNDAEREHLHNLARTVALLRTAAGRDPFDKALTDLVGELATRSDAFRTRWGHHDVRAHRTGVKNFNHPLVGRLDLDFDALELPGDTGLTLTAYSAAPGSEGADKLALLASWNATTAEAERPDRAAESDQAGHGASSTSRED